MFIIFPDMNHEMNIRVLVLPLEMFQVIFLRLVVGQSDDDEIFARSG
jgi:hypothetical protein